MKQTVLQENLHLALSYLQKAIPTRPSLPVLSSVLVEVTDKECRVAATDLYFGVRAKVASKIEIPGNVVIPGKQLKEVIQSLPAGSLNLAYDNNQVVITSPNSTSALPSQPSEEYPPFPQVEGVSYSVSRTVLDAIKQYVLKSTSTDPTRPILTGVCLEFLPESITAAGTDSFRLAVMKFSSINQSTPIKLIIPAKVLDEVQRIAETLKVDAVTFTISDQLKQVFFSFDEVEVFARLIEGEYPPYEKIIPQSSSTQIELTSDELQEQLKRALIFSRDASSVVQLEYNQEQVIVKAASPTAGTFEGIINTAKTTGEPGSIAFNAKYLLDYLQTLKSAPLSISLTSNQRPVLFTSSLIPGYSYIVMPFRINQ